MLNKKVRQFIEQHQLLSSQALNLVALSGGADSVCLLLILQELGYRVEAVHCNFKLRAQESDHDEEFVKTLCKCRNIPLHITHFDTRTYAELHRVSIEMAARQLRYGYFEQLRQDLGAATICVAHHQDDSVETVLLNLFRGTGIRGLSGIKPIHGNIVRPLLCVSRKEIEQWLADRHQSYVTDSTNLVPDVVRNQIRLNVIPQILRISPGIPQNILATARRLQEAELVFNQALTRQLESVVDQNSADITQLLSLPSPEALLFEWLSPFGFSPATIENIAQSLPTIQSGRHWTSASHQLFVHQGKLLLGPLAEQRPTLRIPEPGTYVYQHSKRIRLTEQAGAHVDRHSTTACLDAAKLVFPLILRPVQTGDRFQPYGMRGSKLVSDYLADLKISPFERQRQLVLTDANGHILWLVGRRPDSRFCIEPQTIKTLVITIE